MADDRFHAFTAHAPLTMLAGGRRDGPLSGRTLAVKDLYDVAGMKTGFGMPEKLAEAPVAATTTLAIARLVDAGAEIVGKTICDEMCFSLMGNNNFYPRAINPRAPERFTGGSSAGSAAAVAGGLADIATGSDTGGSVRAPAAFCGLVGLRTTHGLVPLDHTVPLAPSLDTFGWFAADIDLYATVGDILLPTAGNRFARCFRLPDVEKLTAVNSAESYAVMAAKVAEGFGPAKPAELKTLDTDERYECFRAIQAYEAWAMHGDWVTRPGRRISPAVADRFLYGRSVSTDDYAAAWKSRRDFTAEIESLLGDDGLLVIPTVPSAAPFADADADTEQAYRARALRMLCLSGLSGLPQITIPLGDDEGAPFAISLVGPRFSDRALIDAARVLMRAER